MKNSPYALYDLPPIHDLKDLILQKKETRPDDIEFTYSKGKNLIIKTYDELF